MKFHFNTFPFGNGPFNVDQRGLDKEARERVYSVVRASGFVVVDGDVGGPGCEMAIEADHFTIERKPFSIGVGHGEPQVYYDIASGALVFTPMDAAEAVRDDGEAHRHIRDMDTLELGSAWFRGRDVNMDTRELGAAWYRDPVHVADVATAKVSADSADMPKNPVPNDTGEDSGERTLTAIRAAGYAISSELKTLVETKVPFTFVSGAIIRDLKLIPPGQEVADDAAAVINKPV